MVTRQRSDLLMNIPALRKLDAMLIVSNNIAARFYLEGIVLPYSLARLYYTFC
jgi:hypothetical protein